MCISCLCPLETPHKKNSIIEKVCVDFVTGLLVDLDKRERLLVCNCGQVTKYVGKLQECIPVGCLPSAAVAVSGGWGGVVRLGGGCWPRGCLPGGVCPGGLPGGCLPRGVSVQGGCLPRGWLPRGGGNRRLWKHYLAATTLQMVITIQTVMCKNRFHWCRWSPK